MSTTRIHDALTEQLTQIVEYLRNARVDNNVIQGVLSLPPTTLGDDYQLIETAPKDGTLIELPPVALTAKWRSGTWELQNPTDAPAYWRPFHGEGN